MNGIKIVKNILNTIIINIYPENNSKFIFNREFYILNQKSNYFIDS